jgi:hypothetical protein
MLVQKVGHVRNGTKYIISDRVKAQVVYSRTHDNTQNNLICRLLIRSTALFHINVFILMQVANLNSL